MQYETYDGQLVELGTLTDKQQAFLDAARAVYDQGARWDEFQTFYLQPESALWYVNGDKAQGRIPNAEVVKSPLYAVLTDMWLRLGERQGMVRLAARVG